MITVSVKPELLSAVDAMSERTARELLHYAIFLSQQQAKRQHLFAEKLSQFQDEFQQTSPLAKMNEAELMAHLRKTRDKVADELYPDLS